MNYDRRNMPKCFTFVDDWKEWNRLVKPSEHRGDYCSDCLPAFKQQMIAESRCRFPGTTFMFIPHGDHLEIVGVRA